MAQTRSAVETVLAFHEATKHSVDSVRRGSHMLDGTNQPRPWKLYDIELPEVPLPAERTRTGASVQRVLLGAELARLDEAEPTLTQLASILHLSAGLTKRLRVVGGHMYFRAAACTGALYHVELYVITGPLDGLPAGVYHYGVHDNALRRLRDGDFRAIVAQAAGLDGDLPSPLTIVYTSTFWRNSWKYESRAYRHSFWDSGTILANSLAVARANGLPASVVTRYIDATINDLVDVDGVTETSVALLTLGTGRRAPAVDAQGPIGLPIRPLSRDPVDYPLIREAHAATILGDESSVRLPPAESVPEAAQPGHNTVAVPRADPMPATLEDVILKRGSSRRFTRESIALPKLAAMLDVVGQPTQMDGAHGDPGLNDVYLIANAIDGLAQGTYLYRPQSRSLDPVTRTETRELAEHLALDQLLGGDAAANLFFVADMPGILGKLGARGYRTAHLDGSIRAGRVYLAAYALGLGASGLTFYDDEVVESLGAAPSSAVTFLIAVGVPFKA